MGEGNASFRFGAHILKFQRYGWPMRCVMELRVGLDGVVWERNSAVTFQIWDNFGALMNPILVRFVNYCPWLSCSSSDPIHTPARLFVSICELSIKCYQYRFFASVIYLILNMLMNRVDRSNIIDLILPKLTIQLSQSKNRCYYGELLTLGLEQRFIDLFLCSR